MSEELTYATDEQLDMACEYLRQRVEQCPQEPVSIHEVLKEVGMEVTPAVDRVIDLIYQLGKTRASTTSTATRSSSCGGATRAELVERILWIVDGYRFGQWPSVRQAPHVAVVIADAEVLISPIGLV